jgi:hypothetical protein
MQQAAAGKIRQTIFFLAFTHSFTMATVDQTLTETEQKVKSASPNLCSTPRRLPAGQLSLFPPPD